MQIRVALALLLVLTAIGYLFAGALFLLLSGLPFMTITRGFVR